MQGNREDVPAFSRRWTVAGVAAAAIAIAGAALSWHGRAHAFGPGQHRLGGWEQIDPQTMGKGIAAMTAVRLAEIDTAPEQRSRIAAVTNAAAADLAPPAPRAARLMRAASTRR